MSAGYTNLKIESGSTFNISIQLTGQDGEIADLTDYNLASCKIRKSYYSDFNVYDLHVLVNEPRSSGTITLYATPLETSAFKYGRYVYDLELSNGTDIIRVLEGIVEVRPNATRSSGN